MAKNKALMLHHDYMETIFEGLTEAEVGQLVLAIMKYDMTGEETEFEDRALALAYRTMKKDAKINSEKYQKRCEDAKKAAESRWNDEMPTDASAYESMPTDASVCQRIDSHTKNANINKNINTNTKTILNTNTKTNKTPEGDISHAEKKMNEIRAKAYRLMGGQT